MDTTILGTPEFEIRHPVKCNITMENDPLLDVYLLNIEMFHSCVDKPEGIHPALFTGYR
jgi:hypothetical protein